MRSGRLLGLLKRILPATWVLQTAACRSSPLVVNGPIPDKNAYLSIYRDWKQCRI